MRHMKAGRKLGRSPSHRLALHRNLARALFLHGRIITTVEKAKDVRPFAEKLITLARKGTLHARRLALERLPDKEVVKLLFEEIGPRFRDRPGGYTRIIKRHERRLGDGGQTAFLELLKEGEEKVRARPRYEQAAAAPAVAPAVAPPREEEPPEQPATPPAETAREEGETPPAGEQAGEGGEPNTPEGEPKPSGS